MRSAAALEILRDSAIALEHPRAPSKSLSGARAVAPKVVAARRKRLSRETTVMPEGFDEDAQSCSMSSSAVMQDGVNTSERVFIPLRRRMETSSPLPSYTMVTRAPP